MFKKCSFPSHPYCQLLVTDRITHCGNTISISKMLMKECINGINTFFRAIEFTKAYVNLIHNVSILNAFLLNK